MSSKKSKTVTKETPKMDSDDIEVIDVDQEPDIYVKNFTAASPKQKQGAAVPLLPKNIVALVGNTPVLLRQPVQITKKNVTTQSGAPTTKTPSLLSTSASQMMKTLINQNLAQPTKNSKNSNTQTNAQTLTPIIVPPSILMQTPRTRKSSVFVQKSNPNPSSSNSNTNSSTQVVRYILPAKSLLPTNSSDLKKVIVSGGQCVDAKKSVAVLQNVKQLIPANPNSNKNENLISNVVNLTASACKSTGQSKKVTAITAQLPSQTQTQTQTVGYKSQIVTLTNKPPMKSSDTKSSSITVAAAKESSTTIDVTLQDGKFKSVIPNTQSTVHTSNSNIKTSSSSAGHQSLIIGNMASLSPQVQAQVLSSINRSQNTEMPPKITRTGSHSFEAKKLTEIEIQKRKGLEQCINRISKSTANAFHSTGTTSTTTLTTTSKAKQIIVRTGDNVKILPKMTSNYSSDEKKATGINSKENATVISTNSMAISPATTHTTAPMAKQIIFGPSQNVKILPKTTSTEPHDGKASNKSSRKNVIYLPNSNLSMNTVIVSNSNKKINLIPITDKHGSFYMPISSISSAQSFPNLHSVLTIPRSTCISTSSTSSVIASAVSKPQRRIRNKTPSPSAKEIFMSDLQSELNANPENEGTLDCVDEENSEQVSCASLQTLTKGKQVMVMKPCLESDNEEFCTEIAQDKMDNLNKANNAALQTGKKNITPSQLAHLTKLQIQQSPLTYESDSDVEYISDSDIGKIGEKGLEKEKLESVSNLIKTDPKINEKTKQKENKDKDDEEEEEKKDEEEEEVLEHISQDGDSQCDHSESDSVDKLSSIQKDNKHDDKSPTQDNYTTRERKYRSKRLSASVLRSPSISQSPSMTESESSSFSPNVSFDVNTKRKDKVLNRFENDVHNLKRLVEQKRLEMGNRKREKMLLKTTTSGKTSENVSLSFHRVSKELNSESQEKKTKGTKQGRNGNGKTAVTLRSLLKSGTRIFKPSHSSKFKKGKKNLGFMIQDAGSSTAIPISTKLLKSASQVSTVTTSVAPATAAMPMYVLNGTLTPQNPNNGSAPSAISAFPIAPNNTIYTSAPAGNNSAGNINTQNSVPIEKVYSALNSLSTHLNFKKNAVKGPQFVMVKEGNSHLLLKVSADALLPQNLNALKQSMQSVKSKTQNTEDKSSAVDSAAILPQASETHASKGISTNLSSSKSVHPSTMITLTTSSITSTASNLSLSALKACLTGGQPKTLNSHSQTMSRTKNPPCPSTQINPASIYQVSIPITQLLNSPSGQSSIKTPTSTVYVQMRPPQSFTQTQAEQVAAAKNVHRISSGLSPAVKTKTSHRPKTVVVPVSIPFSKTPISTQTIATARKSISSFPIPSPSQLRYFNVGTGNVSQQVSVTTPVRNESLRSLLLSSNPALTHVPKSSGLLPERKKRPYEDLSVEERAAKRRRLEQKYPLPPGVIIKSEPDDSMEYDLNSTWSVTSEIQTGFIEAPEIAYVNTNQNDNHENNDDTTQLSRTEPTVDLPQTTACAVSSSCIRQSASQRSQNNEEINESSDSPPQLDFVAAETDGREEDVGVAMDIESADITADINSRNEGKTTEEDEAQPPVLQPISSPAPIIHQKRNKGKRRSIVHNDQSFAESGSSDPNQCINNPLSTSASSSSSSSEIFDSSHVAISDINPSPSVLSLPSSSSTAAAESSSTPKPTYNCGSKMSRIQHLKELLKQKELQVENIRKRRSEMPEVDLNAF